MKKLSESEIEFIELIQNLWKKKFFIFVTCLLFTLIGYISNNLVPKKYQSSVILKKNFPTDLSNYTYIINNNTLDNYSAISDELNRLIRINLESRSNLNLFASLKNDENFKNNLDKIEVKLLENKFFFYFPGGIDGTEILKDYLNFCQESPMQDLKEKILLLLTKYKENLALKKNFYLQDNATINTNDEVKKKVWTEYIATNSKLLEYDLKKLDVLLNDFNKIQWKMDIFYNQTLKTELISGKFKIIYPIAGFIFGMFLSLIIIFFRNILNTKI